MPLTKSQYLPSWPSMTSSLWPRRRRMLRLKSSPKRATEKGATKSGQSYRTFRPRQSNFPVIDEP
jgi:hypothetical protein